MTPTPSRSTMTGTGRRPGRRVLQVAWLAVLSVLAAALPATAGQAYRIVFSGEELERAVKEVDLINGQPGTCDGRIGFLFSAGKSEYYDMNKVGRVAPLNLLARCTLSSPQDLQAEVIATEAGLASVSVSGTNEVWGPNSGLGLGCTVKLTAPIGLSEGVRDVVVSFPDVMVLKARLGAISPDDVPSITFRVHNYPTARAWAVARSWLPLLLGLACLVALLVLSRGEVEGTQAAIATALAVGAFFFLGAVALGLSRFGLRRETLALFGGVDVVFALAWGWHVATQDLEKRTWQVGGVVPVCIAVGLAALAYLATLTPSTNSGIDYLYAPWIRPPAWGAIGLLPGFLVGTLAGRCVALLRR